MIEDKNTSRTSLENLGEFGLIHHLTSLFKNTDNRVLQGIGDDAAVLDLKGAKAVVSTDMLIEGVHFDLSYVPLKHLGYKSVVVNLSDIYAMNADPKHITVSIAVSNRFPLEALEELYEGIYLACKQYGVNLIGGDTTSSQKGMLISITAIGEGKEEELVYRHGAKEHDLLVVSGDVGAAYFGLQVLEREKEVFKVNPQNQPDLEAYSYLIERQLKPEARKDIIVLLKDLGVHPTSMIDVSDGLASEIFHLCEASGVGCHLYEDKIPLDPTVITAGEEFKMDTTLVAIGGGEDYELLFTISQQDFDKIKGNPNLSVIGHMTDKASGKNLITRDGSVIPLKAQGWKSF